MKTKKWLSDYVIRWLGRSTLKGALLLLLIHLSTYPLIHCLYAQKESKTSIETKIAIESSMENRLKKVLSEITGTEKIVVIVNVQLMSEKKEKARDFHTDD